MYTTASSSTKLNFEKRVIRTSLKPQREAQLKGRGESSSLGSSGSWHLSETYSSAKLGGTTLCTPSCCLEVLTADPPLLIGRGESASLFDDCQRHSDSFCFCKNDDFCTVDDDSVVVGSSTSPVVNRQSSSRPPQTPSLTVVPSSRAVSSSVREFFTSPKAQKSDHSKKDREKDADGDSSCRGGNTRWDEKGVAGVTHSSVTRSQDSEMKGPMRVSLAHKALIGKGSFGVVFQAMDRDTNQLIAVKEITFSDEADNKMVAAVRKELALLKLLDHPHIVKCLGEECDEHCLRIYLEYVSGGSISGVLRTFGSFQEKQASIYTRQMLEGLAYLHSRNIMHRDLKGDNLLVDPNGTLKISDFGTAKNLLDPNNTTAFAGTAYFMAPEVILSQAVGLASDVWSVGCCVIEMLTGRPPFSEVKNQYALMMRVAGTQGELFPEMVPRGCKFSPQAVAFLRRCLQRDPSARPTAQALLMDAWIVSPPAS